MLPDGGLEGGAEMNQIEGAGAWLIVAMAVAALLLDVLYWKGVAW